VGITLIEVEKCPLCENYSEFFKRDYEDCYYVYHENHCCICGHLHDDRKETCEGENCDCTKFVSQEGLPAIKTGVSNGS